jgi:hypothetical protein
LPFNASPRHLAVGAFFFSGQFSHPFAPLLVRQIESFALLEHSLPSFTSAYVRDFDYWTTNQGTWRGIFTLWVSTTAHGLIEQCAHFVLTDKATNNTPRFYRVCVN